MAILSINEFTERVEHTHVQCQRCHGSMQEIMVYKLDAFIFLLGLKKLPRRYKCPDCGQELKKEN